MPPSGSMGHTSECPPSPVRISPSITLTQTPGGLAPWLPDKKRFSGAGKRHGLFSVTLKNFKALGEHLRTQREVGAAL